MSTNSKKPVNNMERENKVHLSFELGLTSFSCTCVAVKNDGMPFCRIGSYRQLINVFHYDDR